MVFGNMAMIAQQELYLQEIHLMVPDIYGEYLINAQGEDASGDKDTSAYN